MSFHTCWDIKPVDGSPGMPLADFLAKLSAAFPSHKFDAEGARQSALRRFAALQDVSFQVPEEVLASYREAWPVDVTVADDSDDGLVVLDFTVWPEPDGLVPGVEVSFSSEEHQRSASPLLSRLAEVLGWEAEDVSDDVA